MHIDPDTFPRVELDFMNRVHAEEVAMLNRLAECVAAGDDAGADALLDPFITHMRKHFADEEAMMRRINFPPYPVHKEEHDRLLAELDRLAAADRAALVRFLLDEVPPWFDQHVATMDMVTARFLAMQGVTEPEAD